MKQLFSLTLLILATASVSAQTQVFDQATKALQAGNSKELANLFNSTVELSIDGTFGAYSKAQAEKMVTDFFTKNPAASFSCSHKGNSGGGNNYAVGVYKSSNGKSYRVTIFVKQEKGNYFIHELKFDKS